MKRRKMMIRALCLLSAAAMTAGAFTACGNSVDNTAVDNNNSGGSADYSESAGTSEGDNEIPADRLVRITYKFEQAALPDELSDTDISVNGFGLSDSGYSIIYTDYQYDEETNTAANTSYLCAIDFEGNIFSKTDITPERENDEDTPNYQNVNFLADGSVVMLENHYFPVYLSEGDTEPSEYKEKKYIVQLAADGTVIVKKDLEEIDLFGEVLSDPNKNIDRLDINNSGDMAICYRSYDENWNTQTSVVVLDKDFDQKFSKTFDGSSTWVNGGFADSEGSFSYIAEIQDEETKQYQQKLMKADVEANSFEEVCDLTGNSSALSIVGGEGDYLAYFFNSKTKSVEGLKKDGTAEEIVNLLSNGLNLNTASTLMAKGGDFYILGYDGRLNISINKITKLDESEVKEKEIVTLASYYTPGDLSAAVAEYNRSDGNYIITVTDYSQYNDYSSDDESAWNAGLTKLNSDIAAGQIPDILSIDDTELLASFSSKGLFADLNTFIDGENGIDRNDYFDNIFRAMETDGKLYSITSSVLIKGFWAKQSLIPYDGAVTWDEIDDILSRNSGMQLFPDDMTRKYLMVLVLQSSYNNFVNMAAGECSFNSPEFVEILERSKEYPEEFNYEEAYSDPEYWINLDTQYLQNKTLLKESSIDDFSGCYYTADYQMGEDVSIIGMPGTGAAAYLSPVYCISVSAQSAHPEAGWELIKSMLENDEYKYLDMWTSYSSSGFPVNKISYRKKGEAAIEATYNTDENGNRVQDQITVMSGGEEITVRNVDQALIDKLEGLISSCDSVFMGIDSGIMDIISEEAASFYAGTTTASQAADNIQSRASIYISEHM